MKVCKECGVPKIVGRDQRWNPNGTITISGDINFRMGIIEVDVMRRIASRLEDIVGPSVHRMFEEGKRKYARHYIDSLLKGPLGFLVRHTKAAGRKAYLTVIDTATALGYGKVTLEFYERKEKVGGTIENVYYAPLFTGDVRGAFESIERLPSEGIWDGGTDKAKITVRKLKGEDKLEERFKFEDKVRLPGDIYYKDCDLCDVPVDLQRFKWDTDKGMIIDTKSGDRVFIMGLNDMNAVLIELEEAIGDVVPNAVMRTNREYVISQVNTSAIQDRLDFEKDMSIKGMAFTKVRTEGTKMTVEFSNFFSRPYLVGRALGLYEGLVGKPGEPQVEEKEAFLKVTIDKEGG